MTEFNIKCPIRYPARCNLSISEREVLEGPEKYKGFFMYQFKDNDSYLKKTIHDYFKYPTFRLFDASEEAITGVTLCKICRLVLASDFGIASVTPQNYNVFMEIGMLLGLQKPILYLLNPNITAAKDLPFDIVHEIKIEHVSGETLLESLGKHISPFLKKVDLYTEFDRRFRERVIDKIRDMTGDERKIIEILLLEKRPIPVSNITRELFGKKNLKNPKIINDAINKLRIDTGFIEPDTDYSISHKINETYRKILEELIFKG